jgi:hypothetical protein
MTGNLYCEKHGANRVAIIKPYEGETTIITKGPMVLDDCVCDSCGEPIQEGATAYFLEFVVGEASQRVSGAVDYMDQGKSSVRVISLKP